MPVRVARWAVVAVVAVLGALSLAPVRLGWSTLDIGAQLAGVRGLLATALLLLGVVCALAGLARARGRRAAVRHRGRVGPRRASRAQLLVTAVVLVAVAVGHVVVLADRGLGAGEIPLAAGERPEDLTVLSLNLLAGRAEVDDVADLAARTGADVLAITETPDGYPERLAAAVADATGEEFVVHTGEASGSHAWGSVLLVTASLGPYREVLTTTPGTLRLDPVDHDGPPLAVAHPVSLPVLPVGAEAARTVERWRSELDGLRSLLRDMPGGVVVGDLNATLDHAPLRALPGAYTDVGTAVGIAGHGTFPSRLPPLLGAAIDHALIDGDRFVAVGGAVVPVAGSDHRALVVRVAPVG